MFKNAQIMAMVAVLLLAVNTVRGETSRSEPQVGDEFEITKQYETSEEISGGSSSSSRGRKTIVERVIRVRDGGLELEYDHPGGATADDRARNWQLPARVFKPSNGPMELLNRPELETRLEEWLKAAGWTRDVCGQWIFTWNAFLIECDPQSVIDLIGEWDLRSVDVREGALHKDTEALNPGVLTRTAVSPNGETFVAAMEVDPDVVRRARAASDVAVGEIMQTPVTLEDALTERTKENVSGTISVTLETDREGNVWRRTKVTEVEIRGLDDQIENQISTETVERHLISNISPTQQEVQH